MATVTRAGIDLVAEDKTRAAFRSVQGNLSRLQSGIGRFRAAIGAAFAVAGVAAMSRFVKSVMDSGDELQKLSIRLGASTEALSQYRYAAEISGVSFEQFTKGLTKLQKSVSDASVGLSTPKRAFEQLGISVEAFRDLQPSQQFEALADALMKVENPTDRTRIAMDLMGRSGADLVSMLSEGSAGILALRQEADELGLTLTRTEADNMAKFNDALTKIGTIVSGVSQKFVADMAPILVSIAEWFGTNLPVAMDGFAKYVRYVFNFWTEALRKLVTGLSWVAEKLSSLPMIGDKFAEWKVSLDDFDASLGEFQTNAVEAEAVTSTFADTVTRNREAMAGLARATRDSAAATKEQQKATKDLERQAKAVFERTRTPLEKYQAEIENLGKLLDAGKIDYETYARAILQAQEAMDDAQESAKKTGDTIGGSMKNGFETAMGALERFIQAGKFELEDFKRLALDIFSQIITGSQNMGGGFGGVLGGGSSGGGILGSILGSLGGSIGGGWTFNPVMSAASSFSSMPFLPFAKGGVMTSSGPVPLKAYAGGGVANSPQMALFGEGSKPEAYVPLPDGRSIPVKMEGGGTAGAFYYIDARGAGPGVHEQVRAVLRQERPGIVAESVGKATANVQAMAHRGGSFSKAMGRR